MASPTNKSWNWTQADSNRVQVVADKMTTLVPLWSSDPRYSSQAAALQEWLNQGAIFLKQINDYLAVQGT